MSMKGALQSILTVSVLGVLFSGYLSYLDLFGEPAAPACPPLGTPGTILGYPPCVYGLVMYLVVALTAALGLRAEVGSGQSLRNA